MPTKVTYGVWSRPMYFTRMCFTLYTYLAMRAMYFTVLSSHVPHSKPTHCTQPPHIYRHNIWHSTHELTHVRCREREDLDAPAKLRRN